MPRSRRKLAALGLTLGMVIGGHAPVSAAPRTAPAGPATAAPTSAAPAAPPGAGRSATVTLLTGDRVTLTAAGRAAVRPGAGRAGIGFLVRRDRDHLTVLPQDALPLIRAGRVDRRLFDVTELIAAGYDDAHRDTLPLLVSYRQGVARRATATPAGTRVTRDLPAIGGAALVATKTDTAGVWAGLTTGRAGARVDTAGGVDRIWLDGRRRVTLDHSVPQIGAPAAYKAGFTGKGVTVAVLDTGVDLTHPDLAGRVAEARNFSAVPENDDTVGHGTHVASIIAGSGAASGGKYRGVAPDATLLSGKVCEDEGCTDSAILAGMQWAAAEKHATVVNMSLSGWDTPEVDPLEQAVQTLTAQTGTLFVTAAGNDGSDASVGSPASADAALAVGAVDRDDELADFSSRGPRIGDDAIKPDITAPGVGIVAARAAHGVIGEPVGEKYVALSGTSMATPHVVGAVALLAQQHPGWNAGRYKALLMASAKPHPAQTAFAQGAGRVDVAHAITEQVTSDPASVSFGKALWPHGDDAPITRTVRYRNAGTGPLTLEIGTEISGPGGRPAPAGMFRVSPSRLTVPAGGTGQVTVTADTRLGGADGFWTGRLVAHAGTTVAVTPLAVNREVESYALTIRTEDRAGARTGDHYTSLVNLDRFEFPLDINDPDGEATVRVPRGRYALNSLIYRPDGSGDWVETTMLARPDMVVDHDQRITLSARAGRPVGMTVPRSGASPELIDLSTTYYGKDVIYGFGLWAAGFDGLYTAHLGPRVSADRFVASLSSQWTDGTRTSPYLYALSEVFPGRMPTGFVRDYRQRDLATVVHRFRGGYPGMQAERYVMPESGYNTGGSALILAAPLPGRRTEHYSTSPGMRWASELDFGTPTEEGWLDVKAVLESVPTAYRAGRTAHEDWNSAPYGPSFPQPRWPEQGITRLGDTLLVILPVHTDAAGHPGGSLNDTARTALYRNGKLLAESDSAGYAEFTVPPGAADYKVVTSARRGFTDLSSEVGAAWTFRSRHVAGKDWVRLPAMAVRFTPPLRIDNSAPKGRPYVIPVAVQRQPGAPTAKLTALTVDVSYDGGKRWQPARVRHTPLGWVAVVRHPDRAGYVSLRAEARDAAGSTVTERIIGAYRLR
ncbi:S8 family serine peptidase [Micromonospora siamensis]|uniref:Subtilase family protein n=1 Tax=Micromonospora siamensis TaxID=299152 RepID=A0A1C5K2Y0_9ACTN|nr:S8 family serine peptidase [Micromonospora siamensis]SCG77127.1 Subtilase family protein [Micromonospora siamensis]